MADAVDVARAMLEAFAGRDTERLVTMFSPDVDLWTRVKVLEDRHFYGLDGVREWLDSVDEQFERFEVLEPEFIEGRAESVYVSCRLSMRHRGDDYGQARSLHWVMTVDEQRGVIVSFRSFRDRAEALAAAGVSPGGA